MAVNAELEARLIDEPEVAGFLIYGDWLMNQGDPRGELVAVQAGLISNPASSRLRTIDHELRQRHRETWLGALADLGDDDFACTWSCGFVDWARIGGTTRYHASTLDLAPALTTLRALPGIAFLRRLVVGKKQSSTVTSYQDVIDTLARGVPAGLAAFELVAPSVGNQRAEIANLAALCSSFVRVRRLALEVDVVNLEGLDLPALESLELVCRRLDATNLRALDRADLPKVERLAIALGDPGVGMHEFATPITLDDLGVLLESTRLRGLRHLRLTGARFADELVAVLARATILSGLVTLDLSLGDLTERGAATLLEHHQRFAHLDELELSQTTLDESAASRLEGALPNVHVDDLRGNEDWSEVDEPDD